jgi:flagellar basal body rod protein FlgG
VLAAQEDAQDEGGGEADQGMFDFSQGTLTETGRTLDLALHGEGFFVVETPEGPLYTRHGVFVTNQNGQIVDTVGRIVAGVAGPLIVPSDADVNDLYVTDDGRVIAGQAEIGKLRLVQFLDSKDKLQAVGENCFRSPPNIVPVDAGEILVKQGYQESSNVKLVDELVNMILVSRMYEANMKLVSVKKDSTSAALGVAMG